MEMRARVTSKPRAASLPTWWAICGGCGLAFVVRAEILIGVLRCAGLPAVIVSSGGSPALSQLASGVSHPRGAPLADLRAVRRGRSLVRRARSLRA
jgi:hypothetical protein